VIAANPLSPAFKTLLDAIGAALAFLYRYIPNYGVDIILLTLAIRVLLLPLAIKQIRSMQAMQVIQPKVRELQKKYKGRKDAVSRQKMQEEQMKLYREHGVNPFGGCLPVLAQFPILIALFGVLNLPNGLPHIRGAPPQAPTSAYTRLYLDITREKGQPSGIYFLGANLICSGREAGTKPPPVGATFSPRIKPFTKDCGDGWPARIPFYLFLAAMIATTYYQQRQMQRASPVQNQQQQMLTRIMPIFFGFIGISFPAGLVIYWTTTNLVQIAQQFYMLPRGEAVQRNGDRSARPSGGGDGERRRELPRRPTRDPRPPRTEDRGQRGGERSGREKPVEGGGGGGSVGPGQGSPGSGGRRGGNRKKRRKR
jgi:YidC/Oxa1 family membrane protein insertase